MHPLVSIIIPIYNAELFLSKTIEHILEQTYAQTEIILVDDGSTDNSYSIAKTFESDRVKALLQRNSGAAVARNTGLAAASGEYIQFFDADDFLSFDKIEKQIAALNGATNKIAVCNYTSFLNDEELQVGLKQEDQSSFIYSTDDPCGFLINLWGGNGNSNFIQTNCWLVPRAIIEKAGLWRNYRCPDDDGEFFARVVLASEGIKYVPGIMNYYRRQTSKDKLSANPNKKYVQNTLLTIELKYQYLREKCNNPGVKKAMAKQYLDFAVHQYPQHFGLSQIAYKRYKQLEQEVPLPVLGGKTVEMIKKLFGWKAARRLKYYLG